MYMEMRGRDRQVVQQFNSCTNFLLKIFDPLLCTFPLHDKVTIFKHNEFVRSLLNRPLLFLFLSVLIEDFPSR